MRKILLIAAAFAVPMMASPVLAEAHSESTPELAKQDWYRVVMVKFHPGKWGEAQEMIEAFRAVDEALGREPPVELHMTTGEWDMITIFKMHNGIAAMGWAENPLRSEWRAEFTRQRGGEDAARAFWAKYESLIAASEMDIAHIDTE